ncbi:flavodoxin domain containing protein [Plasmodium cynomolgi strain B]|uniref:Flavodoxin domain containing protein n=1 Tax=Plasmodium cynomolgi (strain B) TaxID=1120755 RepID=K6ULW8_PLACD|nr:flavodoxin domain containing protein [Plasmodium cynomolgi strain B]GAB68083.1 flavodoxin domain containing protein [Plasmodium cynomolgi strain B]
MEDADRRTKILLAYGSQYGTAYDCCRIVLYELYRSFHVDFFCLNDVNLMSFHRYENVIIIVSTTGYGCYTNNMSKFWLAMHRANVRFDEGTYFHLFGLGDSAYDNYNIVAKKLKKKLKSLNANVINYNLGNYQHPSMHFSNFTIWKNNVYRFLMSRYALFELNEDVPLLYSIKWVHQLAGEADIHEEEKRRGKYDHTNGGGSHYNPTSEEEYIKDIHPKGEQQIERDSPEREEKDVEDAHPACSSTPQIGHFQPDEHFCTVLKLSKFEILKNKRCTDISYFQDVRCIDLVAPPSLSFNVSSLLNVHPFLNEEKTKEVLKILKINYDEYVIVQQNYPEGKKSITDSVPVNKRIKILHLFMYFLDLSKMVAPFFFTYLSKRTTSEMHRNKFLQLADTNQIADYFSYIYQDKRSYYDIFCDFYSYIQVDVTFLVNTLPSIQQRSYSIMNPMEYYKYIHFYTKGKGGAGNILAQYTEEMWTRRTLKFVKFMRNKLINRRNNIIELLVSLYQVEINKNKKLVGLCSDYLVNSKEGSFIYAQIQDSLLWFNKNILNLGYRIVYISTGSSFSSFLGVIRYRHDMHRKQSSTHRGGSQKEQDGLASPLLKDFLFLGLRNRLHDFYFEDFLRGVTYFNYIFVAFSRDPNDNFSFLNAEEEQSCERSDISGGMRGGISGGTGDHREDDPDDGDRCRGHPHIHYEHVKQQLNEKKKKIYVTDIVLAMQDCMYELLTQQNTIFLVSGKSRPFAQNLIKAFGNIIKQKEPHRTEEHIHSFLKKKVDDFSIIVESWY